MQKVETCFRCVKGMKNTLLENMISLTNTQQNLPFVIYIFFNLYSLLYKKKNIIFLYILSQDHVYVKMTTFF